MTAWIALGWLGNGFYFARFFIQWLASERSGRSVTPRAFWWLSLGGCLCLGAYVARLGEPLLLPAFLVNGAIYVRILWLGGRGESRSRLGPLPAAALGLVVAAVLLATGVATPRDESSEATGWVIAALCGQAVWSTRFILQWWYSERTGRDRFPTFFWWYTLVGSAFNIAYTLHLGDVTLIATYAITPIYPIRNLMIARRAASASSSE